MNHILQPLAGLVFIFYSSQHYRRHGFRSQNVRPLSRANDADVASGLAQQIVPSPVGMYAVAEDRDQWIDCRGPGFRIARMRSLTVDGQIGQKDSFLSPGQPVASGLADDDEF